MAVRAFELQIVSAILRYGMEFEPIYYHLNHEAKELQRAMMDAAYDYRHHPSPETRQAYDDASIAFSNAVQALKEQYESFNVRGDATLPG